MLEPTNQTTPRLFVGSIGVTATREGMTRAQECAARYLLVRLGVKELHHGDCVGGDDQFHEIARDLDTGIRIVVHPPDKQQYRAWNTGDLHHDEKPYLERDRDIVDETAALIAGPKDAEPSESGGTWYTIRYAASKGKPTFVIWPDGSVETDCADFDAIAAETSRALRPVESVES